MVRCRSPVDGVIRKRHRALFEAAIVLAICVFCQAARAAPETYDFEGYVGGSKVLDPGVPLPRFLELCDCPHAVIAPLFIGTLVVDLALPPEQRLLELSVFAFTGERLEVLPGHADNSVVSQTTADVGTQVPPPHWEIVTAAGRTAPLPTHGRSIGVSLQWSGEAGAQRQYPPDAQNVDLGTLTPGMSWRMNFTLSDASAVYATAFANVMVMKRRGTGGPNYEETFNDGAAQDWTPRNGEWSAATGDLRNSANTSFTSNTIRGIELPEKFVMLADVYLSWGASGNTAGVLFNYNGPGDFYEVRLNAQGTARLSQVRGGVRTTLDTRTYPNAGVRRFAHVYVMRAADRGAVLRITINGEQVFGFDFDPEDPSPNMGGTAGVFSSWNLARFDNVRIGTPIGDSTGGLGRFGTFTGNPPQFEPQSGTWTIANGFMRSSTNQAVSLAVSPWPQPSPLYAISGRIHLEWSGAGNWGGFVYDYIDPRNYREVRVSRSVPGRVGEIVLAEIIKGVRREVFRAPRLQGSTDRELFLTLRRENDRTIVNEPNALSNFQVRQAPPTAPVRVGLLAAWNLVRFDDVFVGSVPNQ